MEHVTLLCPNDIGLVKIKFYNNHIKINRASHSIKWDLIDTVYYSGVRQFVFSGQNITDGINTLFANLDIQNDIFSVYAFGGNDSNIITCDIVIPSKHAYKKPTDIELCIDNIEHLVRYDPVKNKISILQTVYEHFAKNKKMRERVNNIEISATDAITISKNWDYNNIRLYQNGAERIIQDYERDACETLERLNKYITEKKFTRVKHVCSDPEIQSVCDKANKQTIK